MEGPQTSDIVSDENGNGTPEPESIVSAAEVADGVGNIDLSELTTFPEQLGPGIPLGSHSMNTQFPESDGLNWEEVQAEVMEEAEFEAEPIIDKGEMEEQDDDLSASPSSTSFTFDESAEIEGISNFNIVLDYPELNYEYNDVFEFEDEINDWFTAQDLKELNTIKQIYKLSAGRVDPNLLDFNNLSEREKIKLITLWVDRIKSNAEIDESNMNSYLTSLISLCYIAMGGFGNITNHEDHTFHIFENSKLFLKPYDDNTLLIEPIIEVLKSSMTELSDIRNFYKETTSSIHMSKLSNALHYAMTILYISIVSLLEPQDSTHMPLKEKLLLQNALDRTDLLAHITKSIDSWRWLANESEEKEINQTGTGSGITKLPTNKNAQLFKIKSVVLLFWKCIVLQFGNSSDRDAAKSFLKFKFEEGNKIFSNSKLNTDSNGNSLKNTKIISPTDYHHYRNGLIARYPSYVPPKYKITHISEMILEENDYDDGNDDIQNNIPSTGVFVNSSSRRLSSASSSLLMNQQHSFKQKPPFNDKPPEIHLATPVPSPTLTPQHTGNSLNHNSRASEIENMNGKGRKVFMTHPMYPNIHPFELNDSKTDIDVPYSIKEAAELFYENIREDFNTKQFLSTFEQFIKDENGMKLLPEDNTDKTFTYSEKDVKENPIFADEIKALQRVEDYYSKCLPNLNSLVIVVLQILASNVIQTNALDLKQMSNGDANSANNISSIIKDYKKLSDFDKQKLDLARIKELSLKAASSILFSLLKWFKLSHFLKFEYFASLIFDNDFYIYLFKFLGSNQLNTQLKDSLDFDDRQNLLANRVVFCDYEALYDHHEYNFFKSAIMLSSEPGRYPYTTNYFDVDSVVEEKQTIQQYSLFATPFVGQSKLVINKPNWRYCFILNNLFRTLYMTLCKTKSQRIYRLLETRPTESLRFYLSLYNESLYRPILKIIKAISPFNGKKWRSNNMDLISFVYLFYKVGLKDHWLTNFFTVNLNERLKKSWDHEYALRSLLTFYNVKNYGQEMEQLGHLEAFEDGPDGFFGKELQRLIGEEMLERQQQQLPNGH